MNAWLSRKIGFKQVCWYVLGAVAICAAYDALGMFIVTIGHINLGEKQVELGLQIASFACFGNLFVLAFMEELTFRIPLFFFYNHPFIKKYFVWMVLADSILFGLMHGGWYHIFMQGVAGVVFAIVFLRCGGAYFKPFRGLFAVTFTHFLSNAILCLVAFLNGATTI